MRILVACEFSGIVRDAFIARGHDAVSCDLLPSEQPGPHIQADIFTVLDRGWDMLLFFWPCTRLCNSGVRWLKERNLWNEMRDSAVRFNSLLNCPSIPLRCGENPVPHRYGIGKTYSQIIQPWQYGHKEMKATCLWLRGLPPLVPTNIVGPPPKDRAERRKWARVHNESPGPQRWANRSRTYQGIADAMADQWWQCGTKPETDPNAHLCGRNTVPFAN